MHLAAPQPSSRPCPGVLTTPPPCDLHAGPDGTFTKPAPISLLAAFLFPVPECSSHPAAPAEPGAPPVTSSRPSPGASAQGTCSPPTSSSLARQGTLCVQKPVGDLVKSGASRSDRARFKPTQEQGFSAGHPPPQPAAQPAASPCMKCRSQNDLSCVVVPSFPHQVFTEGCYGQARVWGVKPHTGRPNPPPPVCCPPGAENKAST